MKNGKKNGKKITHPDPSRAASYPSLGESFAVNLRRHRERMDLSQAALAARAGVTTGHISMIERGTRNPSFEVIEHISAALNVRDPRKMFQVRAGD